MELKDLHGQTFEYIESRYYMEVKDGQLWITPDDTKSPFKYNPREVISSIEQGYYKLLPDVKRTLKKSSLFK